MVATRKVGRPRKPTLGERIRELRIEMELSQDAVAKLADLPTISVSKVESWANPNPTIRTLSGIAKALGVTVDSLIWGLEFEKKKTKLRLKNDD